MFKPGQKWRGQKGLSKNNFKHFTEIRKKFPGMKKRGRSGANPQKEKRVYNLKYCKPFIVNGWETRIRTWVDGVRVRSPAAGRSPIFQTVLLLFSIHKSKK
jgi:hypothetical protein